KGSRLETASSPPPDRDTFGRRTPATRLPFGRAAIDGADGVKYPARGQRSRPGYDCAAGRTGANRAANHVQIFRGGRPLIWPCYLDRCASTNAIPIMAADPDAIPALTRRRAPKAGN